AHARQRCPIFPLDLFLLAVHTVANQPATLAHDLPHLELPGAEHQCAQVVFRRLVAPVAGVIVVGHEALRESYRITAAELAERPPSARQRAAIKSIRDEGLRRRGEHVAPSMA